ncbi:MAG: S9 family peptidase [Bacteroidetes bacterium]|nr:S9 family peptidase [Bacteroidota bacterium]
MESFKINIRCLIVALLVVNMAIAQKPVIDSSTFDNWDKIRDTQISDDGKYVAYGVSGYYKKDFILVLQTTGNKNERRFSNVKLGWKFITGKNLIVFVDQQKTFHSYDLRTNVEKTIPEIASFQLLGDENMDRVLLRSTASGTMKLYSLKGEPVQEFEQVTSSFTGSGGELIVSMKKDGEPGVFKVNIQDGSAQKIGSGPVTSLLFSSNRQHFALLSNGASTKVYLYNISQSEPYAVFEVGEEAKKQAFEITGLQKLNDDGQAVYFNIKDVAPARRPKSSLGVDIWNYQDRKIQSQQLYDLTHVDIFSLALRCAVLVLENNRPRAIRKMQGDDETVKFITGNDCYAVIEKTEGNAMDLWSRYSKTQNFLLDVRSGERMLIPGVRSVDTWNSVHDNFITGLDETGQQYYSYNLTTKKMSDLTRRFPVSLLYVDRDKDPKNFVVVQTKGWEKGNIMLLNDEFDLWALDLNSDAPAECLTNGLGRSKGIQFRFIRDIFGKMTDRKVVTAYDTKTGQNGFYRLSDKKASNPILLTMGDCLYSSEGMDLVHGVTPVKAKGTNAWVVSRETAAESPNLFFTTDFRQFQQLSFVYPEKKYNWLTSERIDFKTVDGRDEKGVLYKPENFDSTKKYPVIFHYYERRFTTLHHYIVPEAIGDNLDIPWFVSRGYIVVVPDIHYKWGQTGKSAFNSVQGAALKMSTYSWVDKNRMGIQGHSFGGYETNYIVSHSNLFAAAMSSAGASDHISGYGEPSFDEHYNGSFYEYRQYRLGVSLWEDPAAYIENSPIFNADKITTPLLMMNNVKDGAVPFPQGVELFLAMMRLGKKAWLLQYDNGHHTLGTDQDKWLHTQYVTQFFDHYLKGAPAPRWMTRGIPAKDKGYDYGLDYDTEIKTPGPGLITEEEQRKIDNYSRVPLKAKLEKGNY